MINCHGLNSCIKRQRFSYWGNITAIYDLFQRSKDNQTTQGFKNKERQKGNLKQMLTKDSK